MRGNDPIVRIGGTCAAHPWRGHRDGVRTKRRRIRTAQSSVSPTASTWKLFATTICFERGNWRVTIAASAGVVIESSSPLSTSVGTRE